MNKIVYTLMLAILPLIFMNDLRAQNENMQQSETAENSESEKKSKESTGGPVERKEPTVNFQGTEISLEQAVNYVIRENLTLKSAKYDVIMTDSDLNALDQKYAPVLSIEGSYGRQNMPATGASTLFGTESWEYSLDTSISKIFNTGTMVQAGVKHRYFDSNDKPFAIPGVTTIPAQPAFHEPNLYVGIQQELLKNSFGYIDRKQEQMLRNAASIKREYLINQLSGLVVSALVDYWNVTVQKSAYENTQLEKNSTERVRNIIARNIRYGLSERFDLNQYNALLAAAKAKEATAEQQYKDAIKKLLRTINMPPDTEVEGVTDLVDELPPGLNEEETVKTALEKRVDYRNARLQVETAQLELDMYSNNMLPSLTASFNISSLGQDVDFAPPYGDVATAEYPSWSVGLKMTYPLWNKDNETKKRNAGYKLKQARIQLEKLEQEIRDEARTAVQTVKMLHTVLVNMKEASRQAELFYNRILRRVRQGKFNSVAVKNALDNMIQTRQQELEALVNYNVALLRLDLARNEIFERYNVDVEQVLSEVE